ncbi:MAG: FAD:protein FMN transferase [Solirubrobacteraceae bacterium]
MTESASFPALGSAAVVVASDGDRLADAVEAVKRIVDAFDLACSRFRDDSELSECNRAGGRPLRVSALLLEAVTASVRAAELTDGDVDPTLGQAMIALGYDRDFQLGLDRQGAGAVPGASGAAPLRRALRFASIPGWRTIRLDQEASTVALGRGVSLDLGATAKALAADHAAATAAGVAGCGVLVSLGGDIATAGPAPPGGWHVRVTDDHRAGVDAPGQWITISSGGLATSSTAVRRWRLDGETVHHLLDPASGRPASGWRTASVTAATCLDANIASTAAIVRGERAPAWLASLALPSRLVSDAGLARYVAGWPPEGDDLSCAPAASAEAVTAG